VSGQAPPRRLLCVVGARPNFIKIAPIMAALRRHAPSIDARLLHTGQHYDASMNLRFFEQLAIPAPDISLDVGSASHALQTAEIMRRFEPVLDAERPDAVLVVGDVNSTVACALVAAKKGVRVVHVEAGLRSGDRSMPEEINRILTDQLSERLYTTEADGERNLRKEGIASERIVFVGNVMIDSLLASRARAMPPAGTLRAAGVATAVLQAPHGYAVLTMHRPSNVDDPAVLARMLGVSREIGADLPVLFPLHPRTRAVIDAAGLGHLFDDSRMLALPPLGYLEMLGLIADARVVLTDSGGLQEETTALGVPCLTLRENTERPVTVSAGTNTLVGSDVGLIRREVAAILRDGGKSGRQPEKWDGHAAERIVADLSAWL
jgi:UDP-N-acetylglucosamine 2-epimerase (non-hydrolysing)